MPPRTDTATKDARRYVARHAVELLEDSNAWGAGGWLYWPLPGGQIDAATARRRKIALARLIVRLRKEAARE